MRLRRACSLVSWSMRWFVFVIVACARAVLGEFSLAALSAGVVMLYYIVAGAVWAETTLALFPLVGVASLALSLGFFYLPWSGLLALAGFACLQGVVVGLLARLCSLHCSSHAPRWCGAPGAPCLEARSVFPLFLLLARLPECSCRCVILSCLLSTSLCLLHCRLSARARARTRRTKGGVHAAWFTRVVLPRRVPASSLLSHFAPPT